MDHGGYLMTHFGMTGRYVHHKDDEDAPKFPRVIFHFHDGFNLAFNCPRKLGRLYLTDNIESYTQQKGLGKDFLKLTKGEFLDSFKK